MSQARAGAVDERRRAVMDAVWHPESNRVSVCSNPGELRRWILSEYGENVGVLMIRSPIFTFRCGHSGFLELSSAQNEM